MIVAWLDNRGNGEALRQALLDAGHIVADALELATLGKTGDVLLTDYDAGPPYEALCDAHEKVIVHPHGAGLVGWTAPHAHTIGQFVHGPGQAECLRRAGYDRHVGVIGWNFCEQRPFRWMPTERPRVLFGLQHAMHDGWIEPWMEAMHQPILDALAELPVRITLRSVEKTPPVSLPWRKVVELGERGGGIEPIQGKGTVADAMAAVDAADAVIGPAYTLPCIAIARGVPTIMFGQEPRATPGYGYPAHPLASWEKCREIAAYLPSIEGQLSDLGFTNIRNGPVSPIGLQDHIAEASQFENTSWRSQFIGPAFDPVEFVEQFERAVKEW